MDEIPGLTRLARGLFLFLIFLIVAILLTGGGRVRPVDFISVGAWAAPAVLLGLYLNRKSKSGVVGVFPEWFRKSVAEVSCHPYLIAGGVFAVMSFAHLARMMSLNVNVFDAGFLYQPIFRAFSGPFLSCDICYRETFLAVHQSFTLPILFPFAALVGNPLVFPVLAALLGFLCFLAVGYSFRRELPPYVLAFIFLALLSVRGFREGFLFDLREDLLGAVFFAWGLVVARSGRIYLALIPFALAALSKETGVLLFPFAGIAVLLENRKFLSSGFRNRIRPIAVYGLLSAGLFVGVFLISLPAWSPHQGEVSDFAKRLAFLGKTPPEIFSNLFWHPFRSLGLLIENLATLDRLRYLLFMTGPFLYFLIRGFNFYYLPGLVLLVGNLISVSPQQRMMQFHYELFALPFFAFGLAESIWRMRSERSLRPEFLGILLLVFLSVSGTWPVSHLRRYLGEMARIADFRWSREEGGRIPLGTPLLLDAITYPVFTERSDLRYLGETRFDPAAPNLLGDRLIGDSRFAIVRREFGDRFLLPEWKTKSCGPSGLLCLYER